MTLAARGTNRQRWSPIQCAEVRFVFDGMPCREAMTSGIRKSTAVLLIGLVSLCCLAVVGGVGAKLFIESRAMSSAQAYADELLSPQMSPDQQIVEMTRAVYKTFTGTRRSPDVPLLFRLRPYLTHEFVPASFRIDEGAIDALYVHGKCDSAARTLVYLLRSLGLSAWQFNYNSPSVAHTVVLAERPDGGYALLDPTYGLVASHGGRLIGPDEARRRQQSGSALDEIWSAFDGTGPAAKYYRDFDRAVMSKQGERQVLEIEVSLEPGQIVRLGERNGRGEDVLGAASQRGWHRNWNYIGSRYDRAWQRVMRFPQRTRVTFHLAGPVNPNFITSDIAPTAVQGERLVYEVEKGTAIRFEDGKAGRDWLSLKSYQDVDFVTFEALPEPS